LLGRNNHADSATPRWGHATNSFHATHEIPHKEALALLVWI
jgi:hypothetical protein